jgi:hypothetical protein
VSDIGESARYGAAGAASIDMDSLSAGSEGGGGGGAGDRVLLGAVAIPGGGGSAVPGAPGGC